MDLDLAGGRLGGIGILVNCAARPGSGESIACGGGTPGVIRY